MGGGYSQRPGGIVASEGSLDQVHIADRALRDHLFRLSVDHGTDALGADLHDASGLFLRIRHVEALGRGVRHGFFAIHILARAHRVDHDLLVPVVGNGDDEAVDILVVEQFLIAARGGKIGVADDFFGQSRGGRRTGRRQPRTRTPGNVMAVVSSGEPCMPMPMMPRRTRSLAGTGRGEAKLSVSRKTVLAPINAPLLVGRRFPREKNHCFMASSSGCEDQSELLLRSAYFGSGLHRDFLEKHDVVVAVILQPDVAVVAGACRVAARNRIFLPAPARLRCSRSP